MCWSIVSKAGIRSSFQNLVYLIQRNSRELESEVSSIIEIGKQSVNLRKIS